MVKIPKSMKENVRKSNRICSVIGCGKAATRSVSQNKIKDKDMSVESDGKRVYLCNEHYKTISKKTKKDKLYEKWRREG
ncbi:MAG: hypothetical protein ACTSSI_02585 [Candidatus Helarchaeota archaeon]